VGAASGWTDGGRLLSCGDWEAEENAIAVEIARTVDFLAIFKVKMAISQNKPPETLLVKQRRRPDAVMT